MKELHKKGGCSTNALDLVRLTVLMERTEGKPNIVIGLIDGPVATDHPYLAGGNIREIRGSMSGRCTQAGSSACLHGTFVGGILSGKRSSVAPAICPNCTLLARPIFTEAIPRSMEMPRATPKELATAIIECINAGAHVLNLSVALMQSSSKGERQLERALDYAARRGVITVVAAGNEGTVGGSALTRHAWSIPVVACDLRGRPINQSNLGISIGRRGLSAPGEAITSLGVEKGKPVKLTGTSAATPFVTGTIALLWSEFLAATAAQVKFAVTQAYMSRRTTVVPPLLNAWAAYQFMVKARS